MATRSGGGVSGVVYALVIFVFLAVLGIALAILFYTQKTTATQKLAEMRENRERIVSDAEMNNDFFRRARDEGGGSVFSVLFEDLKQLREWEIGRQTASLAEIRSARDEAGLRLADASVMTVRQLRSELRGANERADATTEQLEQTEQKIESLKADFNRVTGEHQKTVESLNEKIASVREAMASDKRKLQESNDQLVAKIQELRSEKDAALREKEAELRARQTEINQLRARITQLTRQITGVRPSGPDATLQPDGEIISVNLNENIVTINLGFKDRLILGMTFEVFDRETGVQTEENQRGRTTHKRGKATIEIIRFSDDGQTATGRVVRTSFGESVQQGDLISNLVYDKNRVFKFYVYGDFDLDGDGDTEPAERRRVEAMIREWGGKVVEEEELPVDTDFLVLGQQVQYPDPLPEDPPPPADVVRDYNQQIERWKQYNNLSAQARELSIPVLNQNRFLTLVGFYRE